MTRVFGQLFEDERNGILAIQPSKPFFGCERDERHFDVVDGAIDIDLLPTPAGVSYLVGYKELGDSRRTYFTLRWSIPNYGEVDISPKAKAPNNNTVSSTSTFDRVHTRRLASELSDALSLVDKQEKQLSEIKSRQTDLRSKFEQHKRDMEVALNVKDQYIAQLSEQTEPKVKTVYQRIAVPPEPLQERIRVLEQENQRLKDLNADYYKSVLELHQLKLDRAQSAQFPDPIPEVSGSPQQRLINKLLAR